MTYFAIQCLGLIAAGTALACFVVTRNEAASSILLGSMAFTALAWFVAFLKRRSVHCPLCKGTPLMNSGARTHARSKRIPPFSHGTTAMLSILTNQTFRCMYCGSDFDLLKPPTRLRHGTPDSDDGDPADVQGRWS